MNVIGLLVVPHTVLFLCKAHWWRG